MQSLLLEVASYSVSTLYNFTNNYRLMNYSEYIVLLIQDFAVIGLILFYKNRLSDRKTIAYTGIYAIVLLLFWANILPKSILAFLIVSFDINLILNNVFFFNCTFLIFNLSHYVYQWVLHQKSCSLLKSSVKKMQHQLVWSHGSLVGSQILHASTQSWLTPKTFY